MEKESLASFLEESELAVKRSREDNIPVIAEENEEKLEKISLDFSFSEIEKLIKTIIDEHKKGDASSCIGHVNELTEKLKNAVLIVQYYKIDMTRLSTIFRETEFPDFVTTLMETDDRHSIIQLLHEILLICPQSSKMFDNLTPSFVEQFVETEDSKDMQMLFEIVYGLFDETDHADEFPFEPFIEKMNQLSEGYAQILKFCMKVLETFPDNESISSCVFNTILQDSDPELFPETFNIISFIYQHNENLRTAINEMPLFSSMINCVSSTSINIAYKALKFVLLVLNEDNSQFISEIITMPNLITLGDYSDETCRDVFTFLLLAFDQYMEDIFKNEKLEAMLIGSFSFSSVPTTLAAIKLLNQITLHKKPTLLMFYDICHIIPSILDSEEKELLVPFLDLTIHVIEAAEMDLESTGIDSEEADAASVLESLTENECTDEEVLSKKDFVIEHLSRMFDMSLSSDIED